jgi:predicted phosphodiesterase
VPDETGARAGGYSSRDMRIGVLADIHGNDVALAAVLADIERHPVDRLVCLGDAIQGGPQPAEVVRRLRALECPTVMGNADAWLVTGTWTGAEQMDSVRRGQLEEVRAWSLERLGPADRAFIGQFQPTVEISLERGRSLLCFHGSPTSFDDIILPLTPEEEVRRRLGDRGDQLLTGGHTHVQHLRHLGRSFYFNPGSVGLTYRHGLAEPDFDPWAEYAVLASEGDGLGLEFRRVPFDVEALIAAYRTSGRPHAESSIEKYSKR